MAFLSPTHLRIHWAIAAVHSPWIYCSLKPLCASFMLGGLGFCLGLWCPETRISLPADIALQILSAVERLS